MCDRSHLTESALDARARRAAHRLGWHVIKTRRKLPSYLGGYMLIDERRVCIGGSYFELSASDVIEYCREEIAS
jgi:hypothetical protein